MSWKEYQEEAASYFRNLGLDAQTDVSVSGVRTSHDVDVVVRSHHAGFEVKWFIECKKWKRKISKLHVLALREIVTDCGADRGIILSEKGFQSGALEAATLTNVRLTSLQEMRNQTRLEIYALKLTELFDRLDNLESRYWKISKQQRREIGLRPDRGEDGYSGARLVAFAKDIVNKAFRGIYPIKVTSVCEETTPNFPFEISNVEEVFLALEPHLLIMEKLLIKGED